MKKYLYWQIHDRSFQLLFWVSMILGWVALYVEPQLQNRRFAMPSFFSNLQVQPVAKVTLMPTDVGTVGALRITPKPSAIIPQTIDAKIEGVRRTLVSGSVSIADLKHLLIQINGLWGLPIAVFEEHEGVRQLLINANFLIINKNHNEKPRVSSKVADLIVPLTTVVKNLFSTDKIVLQHSASVNTEVVTALKNFFKNYSGWDLQEQWIDSETSNLNIIIDNQKKVEVVL